MSKRSIARFADADVVGPEQAADVGVKADEWARALAILGRAPNKVELGCISAMWSEHCSYKSSRAHLARLPTTGPRVLVGPGENAGVVDVGDGLAVCFKVESHNHPSFIEPFQGAATGVGGILRDVFTMGARPIAAANLFRFGSASHPRTAHLVRGVVRGVGSYGNCFGVPTVWTDARFDPSYDGNILVNAFALGVLRHDGVFKGRAEGVGNPVFYVGAKTGRDGIHGATMASDAFSAGQEAERPTVQVGDPFKEKLLVEACLDVFRTGALIGIQDMGAAGLTSSSFEMASRAGAGMMLDLDRVPLRETGMTAYEIMLSESQERMLLCCARGREDEVTRVFARWDLDCTEVGRVTDDGLVRIRHEGREKAALPARALADEAPKYRRPQAKRAPARVDTRIERAHARPVAEVLRSVVADPSTSSRAWILRQFDREVGIGTLADSAHAAAAIVQLPSSARAVSVALVSDNHACALDPREGARRTVVEGVLRVASTGAVAIGLSDCLNYGNPENPEVMDDIVEGIEGIREACLALDVPVVSGNVSLYNDTDGTSVQPTPACAIVGLVDDATRVARMAFAPGRALLLVGHGSKSLDGASALDRFGPAPRSLGLHPWSLDDAKAIAAWVTRHVREGVVKAARPIARGGLFIALVEMMRAGAGGAHIVLGRDHDPLAQLLGEGAPAVVVMVAREVADSLVGSAHGVSVARIGETGGDALVLDVGKGKIELGRAELVAAFDGALPLVVNARVGNA